MMLGKNIPEQEALPAFQIMFLGQIPRSGGQGYV